MIRFKSERMVKAGICLAGLIFGLFVLSEVSHAATPRCFLYGVLLHADGNAAQPSFSDMIRLNFEASGKVRCEQIMESYCSYNVKEKGYSPAKLRGVFKEDAGSSGEEQKYQFNSDCKPQLE
jgi:hypothetical protein